MTEIRESNRGTVLSVRLRNSLLITGSALFFCYIFLFMTVIMRLLGLPNSFLQTMVVARAVEPLYWASLMILVVAIMVGILVFIIARRMACRLTDVIAILIATIFALVLHWMPPPIESTTALAFMGHNDLGARQSLIKNLGNGLRQYTQSHQGKLPPASTWADALIQEVPSLDRSSFWFKPWAQGATQVAFNEAISGRKLSELPDNTVLLFEAYGPWNLHGGRSLLKTCLQRIPAYADVVYVYLADGKVYEYWVNMDTLNESIPIEAPRTATWQP